MVDQTTHGKAEVLRFRERYYDCALGLTHRTDFRVAEVERNDYRGRRSGRGREDSTARIHESPIRCIRRVLMNYCSE